MGGDAVKQAYARLGKLVSISPPETSERYEGIALDIVIGQNAAEMVSVRKEVINAERAQRNVKSLHESLELARRQLQESARQLAAQTGHTSCCPVCKTLHDPVELQAKIDALADATDPVGATELANLIQSAKARETQVGRSQRELEVLLNICSHFGFDPQTATAEVVLAALTNQQRELQQAVDSLRVAKEMVAGFERIGLSVVRYHVLRQEILKHFEFDDAF